MLRGINRQSIFEDDEDNEKFLHILSDCKALCEFELYGYCLMGNHVHLLLKEGKYLLEQIFRRIGSRYVIWFNKKYQRCGYLFQDRFKSEVVETDSYFTIVLRYIHQNPVKAYLCKDVCDYKWSSYNEYITQGLLVDREVALGIIGDANFVNFMSKNKDTNCLENTGFNKKITDEELAKTIEEAFNIKSMMIQNEPWEYIEKLLRKILRIEGVSTRQLARVTGIPVNKIWKL